MLKKNGLFSCQIIRFFEKKIMELKNTLPKYLSRCEAALHLRVSSRTIDRLIRDNRIKAFKLGKRVLIYFDSLTEENINSVKPKFHNQN